MERANTFPGRFESLEKISEFVRKAAQDVGLDEMQTYSVELAVDEAASNIIEHAYQGEGQGDIVCICLLEPERLTIILKDKGRAFDPESVPDVDTSLSLDDRKPGGAGVFLMRKVMDQVHYEFKANENVLTLVKNK